MRQFSVIASLAALAMVTGFVLSPQQLRAGVASSAAPEPKTAVPAIYPLQVQGSLLIANGKAIRLRGLDWGWWHLMGTHYSEADMENAARWGANVVRLSFSYSDLETDADPPAWKPEGFRDLDDVVRWARQSGLYVILDMHVVPGGQSTAPYCAGGHNLIWTDPASQERFVGLWQEIARRYKADPEVAAYELMNEPGTDQKTPQCLHDIDQRAIDAIRAIDPDKIIVVGGDRGSGPADLGAAIKFSDSQILYTFHWYLGAGGNEDWIATQRVEPGLSGSHDWTRMEKTLIAPPGADHMSVLLRSIHQSGSAWFDDVEVSGPTGKTLDSADFGKGAQGYAPEASGQKMSWDRTVGHTGPGSLKVHGLSVWAGWAGPRLRVYPGTEYHISAWVKIEDAPGDTYLGATFVRSMARIDPQLSDKKIEPAVEFARKYSVPLWVGEFGCDAADRDVQIQWVNSCISLFEKNGMNWTYWNDKETSDPNGMGLQAEHSDGSDYPVNDRLLRALSNGWALNKSN